LNEEVKKKVLAKLERVRKRHAAPVEAAQAAVGAALALVAQVARVTSAAAACTADGAEVAAQAAADGAGASAAALAGGVGVQPLIQPPQTHTEYVCPACGKPLKQVRREGGKLFMRQHVPKKPTPPLTGSKLCPGGGDTQINAPPMEVRETRLKTR
jgi:hypothetical protein